MEETKDLMEYYSAMNDASAYIKSLPIRKEPNVDTAAQYELVYSRLVKIRKTPLEHAQTKNSYYTYRAAWCYICEREARLYLKAADKEKDRERKIKLIKRAVKFVDALKACPPDFTHQNLSRYEKGEYVSDWKKSKKTTQKSKSKKRQKLPTDWQQKMFDRLVLSDSLYTMPILCAQFSGCRPAELAKGVKVSRVGEALRFEIVTAKAREHRTRAFNVQVDSEAFRYLWLGCKQAQIIKIDSAYNLNQQMIRFSKQLFNTKNSHVSAYSYRHAFASQAKAILTAEGTGYCLGHVNDKSQTFYKSRSSNGAFKIDGLPEKKNVKHIAKYALHDVIPKQSLGLTL